MREFKFIKMNGLGNDFVIIDQRKNTISLSKKDIVSVCDRDEGVGCDQLINILPRQNDGNILIEFFNSNGEEIHACGNGSRCAVSFAHRKKIISRKTRFEAFDGSHEAEIMDDELIIMQMKLNSRIIENDYGMWLDTGSPHLIVETNNTDEIDVKSAGRSIRYNDFYKEEGVNVNFVEKVWFGFKVWE